MLVPRNFTGSESPRCALAGSILVQEEVPIHPWLQCLTGPWCPQRGRGPSTFSVATLLRAGRSVTGKRHGRAVLFRVGRAEVVSGTAGQDLLASPFLRPNVAVPLGAHGLREEPEFVTAWVFFFITNALSCQNSVSLHFVLQGQFCLSF